MFSVLLFVCLAGPVVGTEAAQPGETPPAASPSPLQVKENAARTKAADEMAGLAKFCAMYSVFGDARDAYAKALALCPPGGGAAIQGELDKLKDKTGTPQTGAAAQVADRRAKCVAKCADLLAPAAAAYVQADLGDDANRVVALMRAQGCAVDAPLAKLDVMYFDPYFDWHRKKDVDKLNAGGEFVDGAWLDPAKVAEQNAAHAVWTNPWKISDGVHEVRTTLPFRTARQILARTGEFRRFFLEYFAGAWDLKAPEVKLPVIVTGTLAELGDRLCEVYHDRPQGPADDDSYYVNTTESGNPVLCSLEGRTEEGKSVRAELKEFWWTLERRLAVQMGSEYSKHAADQGRLASGQLWARRGLAEFLPNFQIVNGVRVLTHPRFVVLGGGLGVDGAFWWCHTNPQKIPPLGPFVAMSRDQFETAIENHRIAATLTWFLLEGKDRAYRARFVKLLETVFQCREDEKTFLTCFDGVRDLDAEFRAFCKAIKIDK